MQEGAFSEPGIIVTIFTSDFMATASREVRQSESAEAKGFH
jgi:hypothetical protein